MLFKSQSAPPHRVRPDRLRAVTTSLVEIPYLCEISTWNQVGADSVIQSDTAIIILGEKTSLTIWAKQSHHHIGLATRLNDMTAVGDHGDHK